MFYPKASANACYSHLPWEFRMFRIFLKYGCAVGDSLKILLLPDNITTIGIYISDDGYVLDWEFMEKYIKSLPYGDRF